MPTSSSISLASISRLLDQKLKVQRHAILDAVYKYIDKHVATKEELKELEERFNHLPNKEEFYAKMNEYIRETQASRQENAVLPHQISELSDRVEDIESKLGLPAS